MEGQVGERLLSSFLLSHHSQNHSPFFSLCLSLSLSLILFGERNTHAPSSAIVFSLIFNFKYQNFSAWICYYWCYCSLRINGEKMSLLPWICYKSVCYNVWDGFCLATWIVKSSSHIRRCRGCSYGYRRVGWGH